MRERYETYIYNIDFGFEWMCWCWWGIKDLLRTMYCRQLLH